MAPRKIKLTGLSTEDYIHPAEQNMRLKKNMTLVSKGLDHFSDLSVSLVRRITLGKHIAITREIAPVLMRLTEEVCATLDYAPVPEVYVCHQATQAAFCAGAKKTQIILSDYILSKFDADMLRFLIGNLISMLKAGHANLVSVCAVLPPTPAAIALEMPLRAYLRAADMSSDRGGLLACQNFSAAARCILWETGLPFSELPDAPGTLPFVRAYIEAIERFSPGWLTELSAAWEKWNMESTPPAYRLRELLNWYKNEYPTLMSRWK